MINVNYTRFKCVKGQASFGVPGGKATSCCACKEPNLIDARNKRFKIGKEVQPYDSVPGG